MSTLYISRLVQLAEKAGASNEAALDKAAAAMSETLANKGLVHLYGSGHSVLPVQETFPRYGSYVGFNPLTDPRAPWAARVVVTPHIAWGTVEARARLAVEVALNLDAFTRGVRRNRVD